MAQKKFDGVIEAVRYLPGGQVELVRVYERRGPAFSDRVLLSRQELIERLKSKKLFFTGRRVAYLAGTFELQSPVRLANASGGEVLVTGDKTSEHDDLQGVPLF